MRRSTRIPVGTRAPRGAVGGAPAPGRQDQLNKGGNKRDIVQLVPETHSVRGYSVGVQKMECIPNSAGEMATMMPIDDERSGTSCLTDQEPRELVRISRLVQARPEIVWSRKKPVPLLAGKSAGELLLQRALQTIKVG